MQLPEAAQESRQNVLVANHRAELPVLAAGPSKSHQSRSLARAELAGAGRQEFTQPGKELDAGNVFAESQQPYLVVESRHSPVAAEQDGRVECILARGIVHVGADDHRYAEAAANPPRVFGGEVGGEIARQGGRIGAFAPDDELCAGLLQTAGHRLQGGQLTDGFVAGELSVTV